MVAWRIECFCFGEGQSGCRECGGVRRGHARQHGGQGHQVDLLEVDELPLALDEEPEQAWRGMG